MLNPKRNMMRTERPVWLAHCSNLTTWNLLTFSNSSWNGSLDLAFAQPLFIFCFGCIFFSPHHAISVFNFCPNMLKLSCSVLLLFPSPSPPTLHSSIPLALPVANGGSPGQTGWCNPRSEEPCSGLHCQSAQWHTQSAGAGSEWASSGHWSKLSCLGIGSKSNSRDGMRTFKSYCCYFLKLLHKLREKLCVFGSFLDVIYQTPKTLGTCSK